MVLNHATGSNNGSKQISVDVWNELVDRVAAANSIATRSLLATVGNTASDGDIWMLREAGRQGRFAYTTANMATYVTEDTRQGMVIPKASDTTGATGAFVRIVDGPELQTDWFGVDKTGTAETANDIRNALLVARRWRKNVRLSPTPNGTSTFALGGSTSIQIPLDTALIGSGDRTQFVPLSGASAANILAIQFLPVGMKARLEDFYINFSALDIAGTTTTGFVNCDQTSEMSGFTMKRVKCNAPNVGKNFLSLKGRSSAPVKDVLIEDCVVLGAGRFGMEFTGDSVEGVVRGGKVENTGAKSASGSCFSLSFDNGHLEVYGVAVGATTADHFEFVGTGAYHIHHNLTYGSSVGGYYSSNTKLQTKLKIHDNWSAPGTTGACRFISCPGAQIYANTWFYTSISLESSVDFDRNNVTLSATTRAFQIYNAPARARDNYIDCSAGTPASNNQAIYVTKSLSIGSLVSGNRIKMPSSNTFYLGNDVVDGKGIFVGNTDADTGACVDNHPTPFLWSFAGTGKVRTVTGDRLGSGVTAPMILKVSVSGAAVSASYIIAAVFTVGSAPTITSTVQQESTGLTIAATAPSNDNLVLTATVTGTPNLRWTIECVHDYGALALRAA